MNTVDALNKLGQALLGNSYESKVGLTDAETIESIADQIIAAGGIGGGGEDQAYFPIEANEAYTEIVTPFDDIVDACEKGVPCAFVENGEIVNYLGAGKLGKYDGNVIKITFVYLPELDTVYGGGTELLVMGTKILPNKSITFTTKTIEFT